MPQNFMKGEWSSIAWISPAVIGAFAVGSLMP
jgi:hypothetical protein